MIIIQDLTQKVKYNLNVGHLWRLLPILFASMFTDAKFWKKYSYPMFYKYIFWKM